MPLNKFIPLSPDPNITRDSDMGMAQFGHLNTIVDYLNGTYALTNIKIAGINNTAGYIDFSANPTGSTTIVGAIRTYVDGVNLSEVMTFREDGVTSVRSQLYVGNTDSLLSTNRFQILNSANTAIMVNVDSGGSISTNGRFQIYNSARTAIAQAMYYDGATMVFRPMNDGVENTRFSNNAQTKTMLRFDGVSGNVDVGTGTTLGASLGIKGSGSTSATTSLLVQNSSGNNTFRVLDNGFSFMSTGVSFQELKFYPQFSSISGGYGGSITFSNTSNDTTISDNRITLTAPAYSDSLAVGVSGIYAVVTSNAFSINSTTQGFLKPRMTTTQKNAIASPAAGLEVFDTTLGRPCFYSGSAWVTL